MADAIYRGADGELRMTDGMESEHRVTGPPPHATAFLSRRASKNFPPFFWNCWASKKTILPSTTSSALSHFPAGA